ncbi:VOC family protein [Tianweitania sediminis]|uniref:VOC family protein n=1 Tax=Tianweitania sediminis TaxID=1502156 RepID=A0A8J7UHM6_9HYPH|nr:VOC family protein [Tianweitania sediminis]MBP0439354.1 VOC family protein [Tianweitania sediminis]
MANYKHRDTYPGVTAYATVTDARKAAEFYRIALGAEIVDARETDGGKIMHCEARINGGAFMFNDPFPEHGMGDTANGCAMTLIVEDAQAWWDRGVAAGMAVETDLHVAFWGDKYGQFKDPYGLSWAIVGPQ